MKKAKKITLRQRMRARAEKQITDLENLVIVGVTRAAEEAGVELDPHDVMRLYGNPNIKYQREKAVIQLANQYEAELEALYNKQMDLLKDDSDGE